MNDDCRVFAEWAVGGLAKWKHEALENFLLFSGYSRFLKKNRIIGSLNCQSFEIFFLLKFMKKLIFDDEIFRFPAPLPPC